MSLAGTSDEPGGTASASNRVEVAGGRGIVIGDYNTVFQVFTESSPQLLSLIRAPEFKALVDERTRNFVGRDFAFNAIKDCLSDEDFSSGYVVIQGEPGIGKTSLMAQLVRMNGYVHHFNVSPLGIRSPQAFLSNVCAQLIVRYGLDHPALPQGATQDGGFLIRLLTEVAGERVNLPLVIVVDALDEADDMTLTPGANRLFLPPNLPTGVFFVVSTRPQYNYHLSVDFRRDVYLRDEDPRNLEDIRTFTRGFMRIHSTTMERQLARWGISLEDFVDVLTKKSEGNFMYLIHVLRDIRNETITATTIADIRKLPKGLRDYYQRHWNAMKDADERRFQRYQEPVICLLATVVEPITLAELIEWTRQVWRRSGWNPAYLNERDVVSVVRDWRAFLNFDEAGGETRYRVYHASFQDFLRDEVGLYGYHEAISDSALAKVFDLDDG